MPLRLSANQWRLLLRWFVRGMSSAQIARETHFDRKRILRALLVVRREMSSQHPTEANPDPGSAPAGVPVLAIYASQGEFWGEVLSESEAALIRRLLRERTPDRLELPAIGPYSAVVYRRRLYRLTDPGEGGSSMPFGQIEAFWAYLQRQLRSKGGVRRSRLNLYLAEYAWRYNHRKLSPGEQVRELMTLVRHALRGVRNGALPSAPAHPLDMRN